MKVERLGEMKENDKGDPVAQKVVSRGLRPLTVAWVGDLVDRMKRGTQKDGITRKEFDDEVIKRLDQNPTDYQCSLQNEIYALRINLESMVVVNDELARSLKSKKA